MMSNEKLELLETIEELEAERDDLRARLEAVREWQAVNWASIGFDSGKKLIDILNQRKEDHVHMHDAIDFMDRVIKGENDE